MGDVAEQFKNDLQVAAGVSGKIKAAQDAISGDAAAIEQTTKAMAEDAAFTGKSFLEYIEYLQKGATLEQTMLRGFTLGNYKDEQETVLKSLDGLEEQLHQKQIEDIQNKRELNQITGQEELAMYEQLLAETKAYAEERKMKGDMETYKQFAEWVMELDKTIYQKRIELKREEYEFSMDWIEQEQYYNRMGLADELAAYKRVQARYAKGTEERKKMDREIYRVEKEIYEAREQYTSDIQKVYQEANDKRIELEQEHADKVAEINEKLAADIQKEEERYQSSLESRAKSLYQTYGLFDEVKKREEVSGEKLMANLEDQVKEFGDWQDSLNSLSARGLEKELIEELSQMGPSAISQIKALNSMSDKELEKYEALWSIKHAQARDQAIVELEGLRSETLENIDKLRADADEELVKYEATWNQRMDELVKNAEKELDELRIAFGKKIGLIQNETEEDLRKMTESAQKILRGAGWSETGQLIGEGLIEGVRSKRQEFLNLMTNMASDSLSFFSKPVEINSPSRAFYRKGEYIGMGLVNGLRSYQDKTANAAGELGNSAMNGFSNALQSITACLDDSMDMEPTIRPVLDLSELTNASSRLDGLFTPQRTLHLAGQAMGV